MRTLTRSIFAAGAVVGLLALPVAGAVGADNDVSFTVDANSSGLSISNDANAATLDDAGGNLTALQAGTVSGSLDPTTVTDERGQIGQGWTVSVVATTEWVNQSDGSVTVDNANGRAYLDATDLTDLADNLTTFDGMTLTGAELVADATGNNLDSSYTLVSGTSLLGNGDIQYTPIVEVDVPADTPAGTYTATVQQTVS